MPLVCRSGRSRLRRSSLQKGSSLQIDPTAGRTGSMDIPAAQSASVRQIVMAALWRAAMRSVATAAVSWPVPVPNCVVRSGLLPLRRGELRAPAVPRGTLYEAGDSERLAAPGLAIGRFEEIHRGLRSPGSASSPRVDAIQQHRPAGWGETRMMPAACGISALLKPVGARRVCADGAARRPRSDCSL